MEREDGAEAHCAAVRAGSWPSVVVWPQSTEDVVKIMKTAVKYRMPVIPYSGGTSLEGHTRGVSQAIPAFFFFSVFFECGSLVKWVLA